MASPITYIYNYVYVYRKSNHMFCRLARLRHLTISVLVCGRSRNLTAKPSRPAKLDCPGCSRIAQGVHFGPLGCDFWALVAHTWSPGFATQQFRLRAASKPPEYMRLEKCKKTTCKKHL
eukprot:GHVR01118826.1.p1 GENE.GHVR01118826.1~~GHVR01118826.1.p1  ORF type:complete len:119 (-),score=3.57 GHVR01118826.1:650-1006(-)